jgi:hypothetical protein
LAILGGLILRLGKALAASARKGMPQGMVVDQGRASVPESSVSLGNDSLILIQSAKAVQYVKQNDAIMLTVDVEIRLRVPLKGLEGDAWCGEI